MFKIIFLLLISTFSYSYEYEDSAWLKLLRYQKTLLGNYESEVDSSDFFLSPNGKTSPKEELEEFVERIKAPLTTSKIDDNHPVCLFPARATYVSKKYNIKLPIIPSLCPKVAELIEKLNVKDISLVFSSYFIQKPASAFGHTFLKISTTDANEENDYLDYAIDFAAQVTTNNPILYGILGIFGGFKGKFTLMPYYVKIKEYNDMESRDLWDFNLNFTQEEKSFFLLHLFEMNRAYFDYFYFRENCSYHILGLLDAVKPQWRLNEKLTFFVPPIDTIHAINSPSIIKKTNFRASKYKRLEYLYKNLDRETLKIFKQTIKEEKTPSREFSNLSELQKTTLLDFLSDYLDFKYSDVLANKNHTKYKEILKLKMELNFKRSTLSSNSAPLDFSDTIKNNSPLDGHKSKRMGFILGRNDDINDEFIRLEYRFALHDSLENKTGYIPYSASELGKAKFEYYKKHNKFKLKDFTIVNVKALRPNTPYTHNMSWTFNAGLGSEDFEIKNSYFAHMNFSLGYSSQIQNFMMSYLIEDRNIYSFSESKYSNYLGPKFMLIHNNNKMNFEISLSYLNDILRDHKFFLETNSQIRYAFDLNNALSVGVNSKHRDNQNQRAYTLGYLINF